MKYLFLIEKNITRKKTRMFLTLGSFAVALFLFGLLCTINNAFYVGIDIAGADRLVVRNKTSLIMPLPYGYKEKIRQIPGVKNLVAWSWFGGIYQDPKNFFPQFATEADEFGEVYPEYVMSEEQWDAFVGDRQGCIVGQKLVDRFGWKLGDRIPLKGTIDPGIWEFNIRGIFENTKQEGDTGLMFLHYKYLAERTLARKGVAGSFVVKVYNPENAAQVANAIDATFANSPFETVTITEQTFQTGFVRQFGNVKLILMAVGSVVFFTLLLVTGSTMAMAIRERTGEIGVLKSLGYSDVLVLFLVLSESSMYALVGGGLGLLLAKLYTFGGDPTGGMLRVFYLSSTNVGMGVLITVGVGFVSGIIPAINAMQLKIVDALRRA